MANNFGVKETVELEILEIIDWYNLKKDGLGERFYEELLAEFKSIEENPKSYSFYQKDFRKATLKNFPYLIIFKVSEADILVYCIVHSGRNPKLINLRIS